MINPAPMSSRFGIISSVKNMLSKCASLAGALLLAGCFSFEAAPIGDDAPAERQIRASNAGAVEHVVVANNGWYLFNTWPIATGNATEGARLPWSFFRDDVHESVVHGRLMRYASENGCDVEQLNVFNQEQVLLTLPGVSFPLPIPYVATFHEMQLSAVLVKKTVPAAEIEAARRKSITKDMRRMLDELPDGGPSR